MIKVKNVVKYFGNIKAVDDVSFNVNKGEIFGLIGPDGAGKSTTIRMMTQLLLPDSGCISLFNGADKSYIKEKIGYVPQKFSLYGELTVMENIRVFGSLYGTDEDIIAEKAEKILAFTNLLAFKNRLADNLSGGMKQKLALAAALMHNQDIFFLDEPTTGVDPVSRREFWQMLYQLNRGGMTVVVSTPYMDEAELCTKIAFMHNGRIICVGTPQELKTSYPYYLLELVAQAKNIKSLLINEHILDINIFGDRYHLTVNDTRKAAAFIEKVLSFSGINIISCQEISPTLEDVFVLLASDVR